MEIQNLKLGPLTITNLTQRTASIIGGKGTGKTTTLKMLAYNSPVETYIFDPLNVIYIEGFQRIIITKKLITEGAKIGKMFNKIKAQKFIFAFRGMLQKEIAEFANGFFSEWKPKHCFIIFDEIHEFCPETSTGGLYAPEVERAIRHWRNEDCGFGMSTQRPAQARKNVLGLTDGLLLYRVTWTHDKKAVEDVLSGMVSDEEKNNVMQKIQTKGFLSGFWIDFRANTVG